MQYMNAGTYDLDNFREQGIYSFPAGCKIINGPSGFPTEPDVAYSFTLQVFANSSPEQLLDNIIIDQTLTYAFGYRTYKRQFSWVLVQGLFAESWHSWHVYYEKEIEVYLAEKSTTAGGAYAQRVNYGNISQWTGTGITNFLNRNDLLCVIPCCCYKSQDPSFISPLGVQNSITGEGIWSYITSGYESGKSYIARVILIGKTKTGK